MLTQVSEGVLVHQSELITNNAIVVQGGSGVLVVDPGLTDDEMTCLASDIRALGETVAAGFATHPDWDHALWHGRLGDVPRWGTARCAAYLAEFRAGEDWRDRLAEGLPEEIADETPLELFGLVDGLPAGADRLPWDGPAIRVIEHRGHAPGHAALLVEERGVLVAGDMLSDVLVPMIDNFRDDNDPIEDYLEALELLAELTGDVEFVVPGHGAVGGPGALEARIALDRGYIAALRDGAEPDDPRIGRDVAPGWEWVRDIHEGQAATIARQRPGGA